MPLGTHNHTDMQKSTAYDIDMARECKVAASSLSLTHTHTNPHMPKT